MHDKSTTPVNKSSVKTIKKTKRKLFPSENSEKSKEIKVSIERKLKISEEHKESAKSSPRTTPFSERQQIALLLQISANEISPIVSKKSSENTENICLSKNNPVPALCKRNERGETPLHVAVIKGDLPKVQKLLNQGAQVNITDFAGWSPLHEACNHGWYKIAKLLIKFGADVNVPGLDKITPLHDAAINGHENIIKLLLEHGANPNQKNADWRTPLDVANSEKIITLLKDAILSSKEDLAEENFFKDQFITPKTTESRQSEKSRCHPISALCELTMRKNSPQNQTHKGVDKPTSPRLTLRFQSIRSRDDKSSSSAKVNDISSVQPKYQSYCVTMEAKGDVYEFRKEEATVSSTQNLTPISENEEIGTKNETVTSTSNKEMEENNKDNKKADEAESSEKCSSIEKMDTSETVNAKINGGRFSTDSNGKERESTNEVEKEDNRRKRRKSNDSSQSRHSTGRGHKSPSNKLNQQDNHNDQRSPKSKKRSSVSSSDTESNQSDAEPTSTEVNADSGNLNGSASAGPHSPKVPPLKIVIPSGSGSLELETRERNKVSSSKQALPYVVNTTTADTVDINVDSLAGSSLPSDGNRETPKSDSSSAKSKEEPHPPEERSSFQRVTRSSQRMQAALSGNTSSNQSTPPETTNNNNNANVVAPTGHKEASGESSNDEQMQIQIDVHPRKRKLRTKENSTENGPQPSHPPSSASSSGAEDTQQHLQLLNSYQLYLNIRKQVDKRRKSMFIVHPKPPQGFKDYLLNRCSYVLEGNAASRLSVPMISPPQSLDGSIKELFIQQEKERYRLRLQHLIEREKLVLSAEQEILRVHGRAARAMANQTVPLSVCSILKDEEIYNVLESEQDDKDKNVRSRYNGRLLLSWLQDVDDKWEKIKESMLLRHHNEAESLHAVQKLDWEWKMKELAMCDMKASPIIDDIHVPMVHVSDDFDLLPA